MTNSKPDWMTEVKSNLKSRMSNIKFSETQEVPVSPMFKFDKTPKSNNQHLVMSMSPKGFMNFMKQYNNGVTRSKSSSKLPAHKGMYNPQKRTFDLQKYSTNFQVKALQTKTEGFFGLSIFTIF